MKKNGSRHLLLAVKESKTASKNLTLSNVTITATNTGSYNGDDAIGIRLNGSGEAQNVTLQNMTVTSTGNLGAYGIRAEGSAAKNL